MKILRVNFQNMGMLLRNMAMYYNELWKYSKTEKFEQGKLSLQGDLEFVQRGNSWDTDKLSTIGNKGSFTSLICQKVWR